MVTLMTAIPKKAHYVDNQKFRAALIEYKAKCDEAEATGEEAPVLSNYIGDCFIKIATHLSYKANFINYSFRDCMVSDAIENCLVAARKYDPNISPNPFAYYTQISFYAFLRRIQHEKKQQQKKYKLLEQIDINELISTEGDLGDFGTQYLEGIMKQLDIMDPDRRAANTAIKSIKLAEEIVSKLDFGE